MRHSAGAFQLSYRNLLTPSTGLASTDNTLGRIPWRITQDMDSKKMKSVQSFGSPDDLKKMPPTGPIRWLPCTMRTGAWSRSSRAPDSSPLLSEHGIRILLSVERVPDNRSK